MMDKTKIAQAIIAVMTEVRGMEKNSRVGGSSRMAYNGTKDQDVKEVFNKAMSKQGLCMIPIDITETTKLDRWEAADPWSKSTPKDTKMYQSIFTKVVVKYLLLHESGESLNVCGYGHGVDTQDKGAGKATTYAMKSALLYIFMTPVGKIDDTETTHSKDIVIPKPKKAVVPMGQRVIVEDGDGIFLKIIQAVSEGKASIEQAKGKYNISESVEVSLKEKVMALQTIV